MTVFLLMGSGEFEPWSADVERAALDRAPTGPVLVVPTASANESDAVFDRWAEMGLEHYGAMGLEAKVLQLRAREDAFRPELVADVNAASMVFFSGGKPQYLASVVHVSPVWEAMLRALRRGAVYAGCSAGAMVASQAKLETGEGEGKTGWIYGLGLVPHASFGVHWDKLRYVPFMRTLVMSRTPAGSWFVGIDERTAILGDGREWEVFGNRTAMVRYAGRTRSYRAGERFTTGG